MSSKGKQRQPEAESAHGTVHSGLLAALLVGLAFSALLLGEYRSSGLLCGPGGGCDLVRASEYSSIEGVPLPTIGVVYFLVMLAVAALPGLRSALLPFAAVGALAGATFLVIQGAVIGAFCSLCVVVDLSALAAGVLAWMGRDGVTPPLTPQRTMALSVATLVAFGMIGVSQVLAPMGASVVEQTPEQLPAPVAREQKAESPVTVVEYIDFECPACRYQHGVFKEVLADVDYDVRMVYMHSPLPQHTGADGAARAFICVETDGVPATYKAFADQLFTAPELTTDVIESIAAGLALDVDDLRACMESDTTTARLERDLNLANQVGVRSLPTFWIGRQKFVGTSDPRTVREALDRWVRSPDSQE
ncbi:MAG: thioredoxin domain-containing protein [Acidobacteria bacterium]|nr:thioredoxin domain-containing protein [Acidobacteriota bacterium]